MAQRPKKSNSNHRAPQARGDTIFPGITRHAAALGRSRVHLWLVLTGARHSPQLVTEYTRLLSQEGRAVPADLRQRAA